MSIKMRPKPWNVFYAGRHTDWQGRDYEFSEADLDDIAATLPGRPIQIEHVGKLIKGAVDQAARIGQDLFVTAKDLPAGFAAQVEGRGISLQLFPPDHPDNPTPGKWAADHVAFVPKPALKELLPAFGEGLAAFSWGEMERPDPRDLEIEDLRKKLMRQEHERWWDTVAFTDKGFRLPPIEKEKVLQFLEYLSSSPVAFGGESPVGWFKDFIARLPVQVAFEDVSTPDIGEPVVAFEAAPGWSVDPDKAKYYALAVQYQKQHGGDLLTAYKLVGGT